MFKKFRSTTLVAIAVLLSVFSTNILPVAVAYAESPGNNGSLKVHEKNTPEGTKNNDPKVCIFNFEGFGFDVGQTGLIVIEPQGGDSDTTDTASLSFGPADADGYAKTAYLNDGGTTLANGHYKSTLYGKDANDGYTLDLKAKSKVFKVDCATQTPPVETDVCHNIDGIQTTIPDGMVKDEQGNCTTSHPTPTQTTICPVVLGAIHSTNKTPNGWTLPADAEYVDGGVKLNVSGNWDETYIERSFDGPLADIGSQVDFDASPEQYVGIHIDTDKGTLVYEKEGSYAGKWWSTSDFGVASGLGYATFDTLDNIVAANPDVMTSMIRVLYTSPDVSSSVVTSVTVGCTIYTFDKEAVATHSKKVTICHRTKSAMNPYVKIRVSSNAVDGVAGNSGNKADHYAKHTGPVFNPTTMTNGDTWGDIIPPVAPYHNGLNWDSEGQAVYNNNCHIPTPPPVTDVCPNIAGTQTSVPAGYQFDLDGNCIKTGGLGGVPDTTPTTGHVLGDTTAKTLGTSTALPATIPATGGSSNALYIVAASILAYGAAYFLQGRRQIANKLEA